LDSIAHFRWQCGTCGNWHTGLPLDYAYDEPESYRGLSDDEREQAFLNKDVCEIRKYGWYFVRGVIALPIIGMNEQFLWGVWSSLSEKNFKYTMDHWDDPAVENTSPMFGWLNSRIQDYPDTLNLKLNVHLKRETRPYFELEPTDHPLAVDQHNGIKLERIQEIAVRSLHTS
jgi:hypothetical protein